MAMRRASRYRTRDGASMQKRSCIDNESKREDVLARAFVFRLGISERNHRFSQFPSMSWNIYDSSSFILSSYILIYWWFYTHLKCSVLTFDLWSNKWFLRARVCGRNRVLELVLQFLIVLEMFLAETIFHNCGTVLLTCGRSSHLISSGTCRGKAWP